MDTFTPVAIVIMFFLLVCLILVSNLFLSTRREKQKADEYYIKRIFSLQDKVNTLEKENRRLSNWLSFCSSENSSRISEGYEAELNALRNELRSAVIVKDAYARQLNRLGIAVHIDESCGTSEREDDGK